ncbi:MAG TPA: hypothetical protein VF796_28150, partial [Humisphaera sp.]
TEFGASAQLVYRPDPVRRLPSGRYQSEIYIDDVTLELTLSVTVWLPTGVTEKVRAHEEGHRRISERMYAEVADKAARAAAEAVHRRRFTGEGATAAEAKKAASDAMNTAHTLMIRTYLNETSIVGNQIQQEYDRITAHALNDVPEDEAITRAWAAHPPKYGPTTGPSTKPATRPATRPAGR